jgi:hypothetical protein
VQTTSFTRSFPETEFLFLFGVLGIIFHCPQQQIANGFLLAGGKGHAQLLFSCKFLLEKKSVPAACEPTSPVVAVVNVLPISHKGKSYILFEPAEGKNFMVIKFQNPICSLTPLEWVVAGSLVVECLTSTGEPGSCDEELVTHSVRQVANVELFPGNKLTFGKFNVVVHGTLPLRLTGAFEGFPWSGI